MLEYTGSDVVIERVTCSTPLQKDLIVMVLTVGNVYPPQVRNHLEARRMRHASLRSNRSCPRYGSVTFFIRSIFVRSKIYTVSLGLGGLGQVGLG